MVGTFLTRYNLRTKEGREDGSGVRVMTEFSREQLESIVEEQMPGWGLAQEPFAADAAPHTRARPEASTPDIATLFRKYVGEEAPATDPTGSLASEETGADAAHENPEDVAVRVEPKEAADAWDHGPGAKTIIISSEGEIISAQG